MTFDEVIQKRRSIRKYLTVPVEKDKWTAVLEAGAMAPSSGNLQLWKVIIVKEPEDREKLASICHEQEWMVDAPIHFIVAADTNSASQYYGKRGEMLYASQDCAAFMQNMLLKATELGLGSCWVGSFDEERLKVFFEIPPHIRPQAVITIGYGDEEAPTPPKTYISDICFFNRYGQMRSDFGNASKFWDFSIQRNIIHKDIQNFWSDLTDKFVSRLTQKTEKWKKKK